MLWFVDNESAVSSLIRGSSRQGDLAELSQLTHLVWALLGCRVWIEWVDSESNLADGLSRKAEQDTWTQDQDWEISKVFIPEPLYVDLDHPDLLENLKKMLLPEVSPT